MTAANERRAFAKAEKAPAAEWEGDYVYSERYGCVFSDVGELIELHELDGEDPPPYFWECERVELRFDAGQVLDDAFDAHDALESTRALVSGEAKTELQALLDGWLARHPIRWWREGRTRAVVLREAT